jgi:hypothetical protein
MLEERDPKFVDETPTLQFGAELLFETIEFELDDELATFEELDKTGKTTGKIVFGRAIDRFWT